MEFENVSQIKTVSDWTRQERETFHFHSLNGHPLPQNRFVTACFYNTQKYLPNEFQTIRQRNVYYDVMSQISRFNQMKLWNNLLDIKFFDATNVVTSAFAAGFSEGLVGSNYLSRDTQFILRDVNTKLFHFNMGILNQLLFVVKYPYKFIFGPVQNGHIRLSALDFDIQMVEYEQKEVEDYLNLNKSVITAEIISEINNTVNPTWLQRRVIIRLLINPGLEWAKKVHGVSSLNFMDYRHRIAIGKALVFNFHRKSYQEYENHMFITGGAKQRRLGFGDLKYSEYKDSLK